MTTSLSRLWIAASLAFLAAIPLSAMAQNTLTMKVYYDSTATYVQDSPWCDPATNPATCIPQQGIELCIEGLACATTDANGAAAIAYDGDVSTTLFVCLTDSAAWTIVSGTTDTTRGADIDPAFADCARAENLTGTDERAIYVEATAPTLSVTDSPDPIVAGFAGGVDNLLVSWTVANLAGPDIPADKYQLTIAGLDALPTGVTFSEALVGSGTYVDGVWTLGAVAAGASPMLGIRLSVASDAQPCTDCISLTGTLSDVSDPGNPVEADTADSATSIEREFDLGLAVVDAPDPVLAGSGTGNLTHTFTLSRSGPSDAAGVAVELVPTLSGATLDSAVASIGSVVGTTWTVGDWPAAGNGTDQTLTLTLTVPSSVGSCTDCISAQGTVSATSGTDTNADNDVAIDPTSVTAASDITTTFATSIDFANDDDSTVTAMLTCNAGIPLTQSFDISEGSPVNFTVTNLPFTSDGTKCEITVDGLGDAYMLAPESCLYEVGDFAEDGMNVCAFVASPMPTAVEVITDFAGVEDPNIETSFETAIYCEGVSEDAAGPYVVVDFTVTTSPYTASWYADPDGGADCTITLTPMSSAAEGDMCEFSFMLGDEEAGCTVVATVFFEGIPTLSQYGMAIMVLLMLGVGFVGMRRFV